MLKYYEPLSSISFKINLRRYSVDADELTYSMHVVLRFEIERAIFTGEAQVVGQHPRRIERIEPRRTRTGANRTPPNNDDPNVERCTPECADLEPCL